MPALTYCHSVAEISFKLDMSFIIIRKYIISVVRATQIKINFE